jgi:cytochrome c oxidase subunit 3
MPGTTIIDDLEIVIDDIGGGGGKEPPAGGDDGGDGDPRRRRGEPSGRRYTTAITLVLVSILMFFMGLVSAFIVLRVEKEWVPVHLPPILWVNTVILLASSVTIELARRRLGNGDLAGFPVFWRITTALGALFLVGQLVAWRQLILQGVYVASNQASSFFYIFTALHGVHLLGGIGALLYVLFRKFENAKVSRSTAAEIVSYYWHFMDGLWIFLLALLYLGK